jgi:hypothetical protein
MRIAHLAAAAWARSNRLEAAALDIYATYLDAVGALVRPIAELSVVSTYLLSAARDALDAVLDDDVFWTRKLPGTN